MFSNRATPSKKDTNNPKIPMTHTLNPNVANVGGLQIQGVKGDVVVLYFESLTTQKLKSSSVPEG